MSTSPGRAVRAPPIQLAVALAVSLTAGCARAETLTATPQTVAAVLAKAGPGDVVRLADGDYAGLAIRGRSFSPALTIDAGGATIRDAMLRRVVGVSLKGGTWRTACAGDKCRSKALQIIDSDAVNVDGAAFAGDGRGGFGAFVVRSTNVAIRGSAFAGFRTGLVFSESADFAAVGNDFSRMGADGLDVALSRRGRIEANSCRDFATSDRAHPDCIQAWSRPTAPPVSDLTIRWNRVEGAMQGIFLGNHVRDGVDDGGFDRITIEDNDIASSFGNGVRIVSGRDSRIANNRVRTLDRARMQATVSAIGDIEVCGNVTARGAGRPGAKDKACADASADDSAKADAGGRAEAETLRAMLGPAQARIAAAVSRDGGK